MISADGRYVVFESYLRHPGTCYTPGDSDPGGVDYTCTDVFRYDRLNGRTLLVSATMTGDHSNGLSYGPSISEDGSRVVFLSTATNLFGREKQNRYARAQLYVRNVTTGRTQLVSISSTGHPGNWSTESAEISGNGRWAVFESGSDNLTVSAPNSECDRSWSAAILYSPCGQIYLRDLTQGKTIRISGNTTQGNGDSAHPSISKEGSVVVFQSRATNLTSEKKTGTFVYTGHDGALRWIPDSPPAYDGGVAALSGDGSVVVYTNNDATSTTSVFRYEVGTGSNGEVGRSFQLSLYGISFDGKRMLVSKAKQSSTCRPGYYAKCSFFLYVSSLQGTAVLVVTDSPFATATMSAESRLVAFDSSATDIVKPDPNGTGVDVYVRDLERGSTVRIPR